MLVQRKVNAILLALFTVCLLTVPANVSAEYVCGQDLDGDGYSDGEGETAGCLSVGADWQCPVGEVSCIKDEVEPVCPEGGVLNPDREMCQVVSDVSCPDLSYIDNSSRNRCEKPPVCPIGYIYDLSAKTCQTTTTATYPATISGGTTFNVPLGYSGSYDNEWGGCTFGPLTTNPTSASYSGWWMPATCPAKIIAYVAPTATDGVSLGYSGSYDNEWGGCTFGPLTTNPTNFYCPAWQCQQSPLTCPAKIIASVAQASMAGLVPLGFSGYFDSSETYSCALGPLTTNPTNFYCPAWQCQQSPLTCPAKIMAYVAPVAGIYGGTNTCPNGGTLSGTTCTVSTVVQSDPICPSGTIDQTNNVCFAAYVPSCPSNYTYNGLPVNMCEMAASCIEGVYNPESNLCSGVADVCPLGNQYACFGELGAAKCSPNPCFDLSLSGNDVDSSPEDLMLKSDGDVDAEGNCLDQIYIFSGTGSRCRPPGVTVGTMNNCCDSDEPVMGDTKTGNRITQSISAITTAYEIGQVAYYGSALATGSASVVAVSGTTGAITTMTVVTAGGATTTLTGAAATGAYGALASGATTTAGAVSAGMQSYAVALFNPATIAFTAVAYVAIKILMGNGCDQGDIMTAMLRDSGNCHYLGKVCDRRWPAVGCVQRSKRFCCFNSKMGRIIHEQGRPQLLTFGLEGAWGTPSEPNCRGFTADEFQMLDFSKIDMSEYFADMQAGLQESIEGAQQKALDKVQQHYDQTRL